VSPGQGSQSPKMLSTWGDKESLDKIGKFSEIISFDLIDISENYSAEQIRRTNLSQPLIVTASLVSYLALNLTEEVAKKIIFTGHSVGEFVATALSGVLSIENVIKLVGLRGSLMEKASQENNDTGMFAVLGGDKLQVIKYLNDLGITAANVNSQGQIVAAGTLEKLNKLKESPPEGTRIRPLEVSGAFHTNYMESAMKSFESSIVDIELFDPVSKIISNTDGEILTDKNEIVSRLVSQIVSPVRWDLCQAKMLKMGVTGMLELAPGGTLTGIAKREIPTIETFAIKTSEDIAAAREFINKHIE